MHQTETKVQFHLTFKSCYVHVEIEIANQLHKSSSLGLQLEEEEDSYKPKNFHNL